MRKPSSSSVTLFAFRVLLLIVAAGAVFMGFFVTRTANQPQTASGVFYLCPMHPEVTSLVPGDCPICRMELEPQAKQGGKAAAAADSESSIADAAPTTFVLPEGAAISSFDALGFGKIYQTTREMRAPAWAETREIGFALFYRDEIALLAAHEEAIFYPSTYPKDGISPGSEFGIKVQRIDEAPMPWDDATSLVRFRVLGKAELLPDQTGWVKFGTKVSDIPAVRASAVIRSPSGPYVLLVADDKRTLTKRPIEIGSVVYAHAAVLSGLARGERVATLNTFFLDAERRFSGRTAP